jgi:hypothetical protein
VIVPFLRRNAQLIRVQAPSPHAGWRPEVRSAGPGEAGQLTEFERTKCQALRATLARGDTLPLLPRSPNAVHDHGMGKDTMALRLFGRSGPGFMTSAADTCEARRVVPMGKKPTPRSPAGGGGVRSPPAAARSLHGVPVTWATKMPRRP